MKTMPDFLKAYGRVLAAREEKRSVKKPIERPVVVSREYGSGGAAVAEGLARKLGFQFVQKQILEEIASRAKVAPDLVEMFDERPANVLEIFGTSLLRGSSMNRAEFDRYLKLTISGMLELGSVVILGRGAVFLAEPGRALRVRVVAPLGVRVRSLMERFELTERQARDQITKTDKEREIFHKRAFGQPSALPEAFDVAINTHCLSTEDAVQIALEAYHRIGRPSPG